MPSRWLLLALGLWGCGDGATDTAPEGDAGLIEDGPSDPMKDGAAVTDASTATDSGSDASLPGGEAVFSDDFEDGELDDDWDVLNVCSGCAATIEQGVFVAKTKSVLAQDTAFAHVRTTVMGAPSRIRLSFDATFPSVTLAQGTVAIATVDVSTSHFFSLYLRDGDTDAPGPALQEEGLPGSKRHPLAGLPPAGTKTRVSIDIDLGAGTASVAWGGTVVLANSSVAKTTADDPTIRVGLMYVYGPQDPLEVRVDDVLLEYY